jgi:GcrA cell cycle regulator
MKPTWTPERAQAAVDLRMSNKTASEIAAILGGVTKNAVVGFLHRYDGRYGPHRPKPQPKPKKPKAERRNPILAKATTPASLPVEPPYIGPSVSFEELRYGACRWPVTGDSLAGTLRYCGDPAIDGRSYCAGHMHVAYVYARPRRKA